MHAISSTKPMSDTLSLTIFDIDIAGPFKIKGLKGERFFLTITCRGSRAIWVYALKHKADAYDTLIEWYNMITTQFNPYSPEQNGIAERLNRYLIERLIAICTDKNIPLFLWPQIIQGIAHIKNRSYNSVIKKSPFEVLFGKKPTLDYIRVLGSLTYVLVNKRTNKFEDKSDRGILVGYKSANNFLVYIPEKRAIISSKNVLIKEDLTFKDEVISKEELESFDKTLNDCETSDCSNRVISSPINTPKSDLSRAENSEKIDSKTADNSLNEEKVIEDIELDLFNDIAEESIVEIPKRGIKRRRDYSNWVPNVTTRSQAKDPDIALAIQNNKRLIQEQKEAYSVYRNVINLACQAFISSKSDKEIKLSPDPERILIKKDPELKAINKEIASLENHNTWKVVDSNTKTIKLLKTRWVYKIKELESEYYELKARFVAKGFKQLYVNKFGFKLILSENCILVNKELKIIICIYVDNLALISPDISTIKSLIKELKHFFKLKDLELIKDYLARFDLSDYKPKNTPIDSKVKLEPNPNKATKEDILWFQFSSNPSDTHILAAKNVFRYLKGSIKLGLVYINSSSKYVSGYCDSD
ncbi:uncharacterized protein RCO7_10055 [Rhynchosporium graminicola]|uniref:Integrase catalytic domain-containing protein n=1 Tax=Rhynchosporium graminicola TaxID=2792576 RepID=A0A1E1KY34_9HELO|nr:uncharacterized protein RCO7_10055 [Rhynchosporium commune]